MSKTSRSGLPWPGARGMVSVAGNPHALRLVLRTQSRSVSDNQVLGARLIAAAANLPGRWIDSHGLRRSNVLRLVLRTQPRSENRRGLRRFRETLID